MKLVDYLKKHGRSKNDSDDEFDPKELKMGIEVELEHGNNRAMAKEIAKDHLRELPDYYTRLAKMEKEGETAKEKAKTAIKAESFKNKIKKIFENGDEDGSNLATETEVVEWLKKNPYPNDKVVHNWAEKNGFNVHKLEKIFYKLATKYALKK